MTLKRTLALIPHFQHVGANPKIISPVSNFRFLYFGGSRSVPNMVSLTAGDLNRNGTDDLALTWGHYRGPEDNSGASRAVVLYGSNTNMFHEKRDIELLYDEEPIVRAAFAHGDIQGDNMPELILGGQLHADIAGDNLFSRFVAVYVYDGHRDRFVQATARNFDLFERTKRASLFIRPWALIVLWAGGMTRTISTAPWPAMPTSRR